MNDKVISSDLNENQNHDFKERTKIVFETIDNIETMHQGKRKTYDRDAEDDEEVSAGEVYLHDDGDEENSHSNSAQQLKMLRKQPDHVANPHKYKKYSLEDVEDNKMSGRANTQAAMDFLSTIKAGQQQQQQYDDDSVSQEQVFNKQFGARATTGEEDEDEEVTLDDEDEVDEDLNENSSNSVQEKTKNKRRREKKTTKMMTKKMLPMVV